MSAGRDAYRNGTRIVRERVDKLGRAVGIEVGGRLIRSTPVAIGRARGNWNASVGKEDPSTDPDRRAPEALSEGQQKVAGFRLWRGHKLYWTNGLPYIGRLNNGYSKQAPAGYIQTTVREMRSFVDATARRLNVDIRRG